MLFHEISQTSRRCWPPQSKLTIDESMVAFNGNHLEKAYIPHRPIKNGFKMSVYADISGYAIRVFPSFGRPKVPYGNLLIIYLAQTLLTEDIMFIWISMQFIDYLLILFRFFF